MKRMKPLDAINKGHEAQERVSAIGDLLSGIDDTVSDNTTRIVGHMLMDYADTMKECLDTLWEKRKGGAA